MPQPMHSMPASAALRSFDAGSTLAKDASRVSSPLNWPWARAKGQFKGELTRKASFARVEPASKERKAADAGIECIGCGICYASCDVVSWQPDYLGPAALNRAWTLANDVRDVQQTERLRAVAGDAGCHSCHTQGSCTERCPKQLAPTLSIAGLKRKVARAAVRGEL